MAYLLGSIIGALLPTYLLSALGIWLLKKAMGDTPARLLVGFAIAYVAMFILSGLGNADGGPFNPWRSLPFYTLGFVVWFAVQWFSMQGRREKTSLRMRRPLELD